MTLEQITRVQKLKVYYYETVKLALWQDYEFIEELTETEVTQELQVDTAARLDTLYNQYFDA